jgi:hypothetical protein
MKKACLLICLIFFSPGVSSAFDITGLQPTSPYGVFSTFSAESLPRKNYALELGFERSREPDFYRFLLKGAYGISDSLEFNMIIPYVYDFGDSIDGMEDISFGLKHRFYDEGKYGPSVAYMLNASLPSGREVFSTEGRVGIGLIVSKRIGPFQGHANFFYEYPWESRLQDELSFSGGIEFSASHNFKILGEFFAKKAYSSDEYDQLETRLGYRIRTTESIYTTLGIGLDFNDRSPEYRLMLSVSFVSPGEERKIRKIYEEE